MFALAALATHRLWVTEPARIAVTYGAVGSITLWSFVSALLLGAREPALGPILAGLLAAAALGGIGAWWKPFAGGLGALVLTLISATGGSALTGSGWGYTLGAGVGIALVAVAARQLPDTWRPSLTWGGAPAYAFTIGGAIFGVVFVLARTIAGPALYTQSGPYLGPASRLSPPPSG